MVTTHTLQAMSVLVLGVVLFATPAWAALEPLEHRAGFPSIQGPQHVGVHEGQPHGAESISTYRGGLSPDSHKGRDLNLKSVGGGVDGSRTTTSSHSPIINVRPGEIPHHDVGDAGIPLWRW